MPNDFETCTTGTRNLVAEQGARLERQEDLLNCISDRLYLLATGNTRSADEMRQYARELREWIADKRADR